MIYEEWLNKWLEHYIKPSSKDKTYRRYKEVVTYQLIPKFGKMEMGEITPINVQFFVTVLLQSGNIKTGKGLSANSVNSIISVIQGSFETAYRLGIVDKYEMNKIKRPKAKEKQVSCFSQTEQKKIEHAVLNDKRDKMKGVIICLYTGLRIGELLALEWTDVDFKNGELSVTKTCHDGKDENGAFTRITDAPKTDSSIRVIPVPKPILALLKEMKKISSSPFVISGKSEKISVRSYQRSFEALLKKEKIPHRGFHSLRHTFATRALECGMDVKTLSEILGHKSPTITLNRYVHSMLNHKRDMMNRLGRLL